MKKVNYILFLLGMLVFLACSKERVTKRRLSGGTWNIVKATITTYDGTPVTKEEVTYNVGTLEFNAGGTCDWVGKKGTYNIIGSTHESNEGFLDVDLGTEYYHITIKENSRKKFVLEDQGNFQTAYFTGFIIRYELEKN